MHCIQHSQTRCFGDHEVSSSYRYFFGEHHDGSFFDNPFNVSDRISDSSLVAEKRWRSTRRPGRWRKSIKWWLWWLNEWPSVSQSSNTYHSYSRRVLYGDQSSPCYFGSPPSSTNVDTRNTRYFGASATYALRKWSGIPQPNSPCF